MSERCVDLVTNGLFAHIRERYRTYPSIELLLTADFESEQGERFFNQLTDNLQMNVEIIIEIPKIPVTVSTDAGY
ncbi:hypothetical protein AO242_21195 [Pseudomonas sp. ICMP 561]|nr:hypothetical protein AO242_21195 [Pseudomonas sp. ICMP 561]